MAVTITQQQIDDLATAIASGVLSVGQGDKRVQYRSLAEMRETLAWMEMRFAQQNRPKAILIQPSRGE